MSRKIRNFEPPLLTIVILLAVVPLSFAVLGVELMGWKFATNGTAPAEQNNSSYHNDSTSKPSPNKTDADKVQENVNKGNNDAEHKLATNETKPIIETSHKGYPASTPNSNISETTENPSNGHTSKNSSRENDKSKLGKSITKTTHIEKSGSTTDAKTGGKNKFMIEKTTTITKDGKNSKNIESNTTNIGETTENPIVSATSENPTDVETSKSSTTTNEKSKSGGLITKTTYIEKSGGSTGNTEKGVGNEYVVKKTTIVTTKHSKDYKNKGSIATDTDKKTENPSISDTSENRINGETSKNTSSTKDKSKPGGSITKTAYIEKSGGSTGNTGKDGETEYVVKNTTIITTENFKDSKNEGSIVTDTAKKTGNPSTAKTSASPSGGENPKYAKNEATTSTAKATKVNKSPDGNGNPGKTEYVVKKTTIITTKDGTDSKQKKPIPTNVDAATENPAISKTSENPSKSEPSKKAETKNDNKSKISSTKTTNDDKTPDGTSDTGNTGKTEHVVKKTTVTTTRDSKDSKKKKPFPTNADATTENPITIETTENPSKNKPSKNTKIKTERNKSKISTTKTTSVDKASDGSGKAGEIEYVVKKTTVTTTRDSKDSKKKKPVPTNADATTENPITIETTENPSKNKPSKNTKIKTEKNKSKISLTNTNVDRPPDGTGNTGKTEHVIKKTTIITTHEGTESEKKKPVPNNADTTTENPITIETTENTSKNKPSKNTKIKTGRNKSKISTTKTTTVDKASDGSGKAAETEYVVKKTTVITTKDSKDSKNKKPVPTNTDATTENPITIETTENPSKNEPSTNNKIKPGKNKSKISTTKTISVDKAPDGTVKAGETEYVVKKTTVITTKDSKDTKKKKPVPNNADTTTENPTTIETTENPSKNEPSKNTKIKTGRNKSKISTTKTTGVDKAPDDTGKAGDTEFVVKKTTVTTTRDSKDSKKKKPVPTNADATTENPTTIETTENPSKNEPSKSTKIKPGKNKSKISTAKTISVDKAPDGTVKAGETEYVVKKTTVTTTKGSKDSKKKKPVPTNADATTENPITIETTENSSKNKPSKDTKIKTERNKSTISTTKTTSADKAPDDTGKAVETEFVVKKTTVTTTRDSKDSKKKKPVLTNADATTENPITETTENPSKNEPSKNTKIKPGKNKSKISTTKTTNVDKASDGTGKEGQTEYVVKKTTIITTKNGKGSKVLKSDNLIIRVTTQNPGSFETTENPNSGEITTKPNSGETTENSSSGEVTENPGSGETTEIPSRDTPQKSNQKNPRTKSSTTIRETKYVYKAPSGTDNRRDAQGEHVVKKTTKITTMDGKDSQSEEPISPNNNRPKSGTKGSIGTEGNYSEEEVHGKGSTRLEDSKNTTRSNGTVRAGDYYNALRDKWRTKNRKAWSKYRNETMRKRVRESDEDDHAKNKELGRSLDPFDSKEESAETQRATDEKDSAVNQKKQASKRPKNDSIDPGVQTESRKSTLGKTRTESSTQIVQHNASKKAKQRSKDGGRVEVGRISKEIQEQEGAVTTTEDSSSIVSSTSKSTEIPKLEESMENAEKAEKGAQRKVVITKTTTIQSDSNLSSSEEQGYGGETEGKRRKKTTVTRKVSRTDHSTSGEESATPDDNNEYSRETQNTQTEWQKDSRQTDGTAPESETSDGMGKTRSRKQDSSTSFTSNGFSSTDKTDIKGRKKTTVTKTVSQSGTSTDGREPHGSSDRNDGRGETDQSKTTTKSRQERISKGTTMKQKSGYKHKTQDEGKQLEKYRRANIRRLSGNIRSDRRDWRRKHAVRSSDESRDGSGRKGTRRLSTTRYEKRQDRDRTENAYEWHRRRNWDYGDPYWTTKYYDYYDEDVY